MKPYSHQVCVYALCFLSVIAILSGSCSFKHYRLGMDERVPEVESFRKAPYYYGRVETVSGEIGILPVTNTIPLSQEYPATRCDALRPILNEMNTFLAQWKAVTFIDEIALPRRDVPEIYIDNVTDDLFYTMGKGPRSEMYLTRITPSLEWSKHLANKVAEQNIEHVLYINVGFGNYAHRHEGWSEFIDLGTGYRSSVPWHAGRSTNVLYVTGVLLDKNGKLIRAGAEGILPMAEGFWDIRPGFGTILRKILPEDRRTDLPGQPLTWKVSLRNLVAQLLERDDLILRPESTKS